MCLEEVPEVNSHKREKEVVMGTKQKKSGGKYKVKRGRVTNVVSPQKAFAVSYSNVMCVI